MTTADMTKKTYAPRAADLARVEGELRARIESRAWLPGVMLPSRRDLAKELRVDLHTVQRAVAPLLADGTLRADGGRGTFVADHPTPTPPAQAPASPAQVGTLGIVAAYDLGRAHPDDVAGVGTRDVLRSLERTFLEAGGRTVFFNLFRSEGAWVTVPEATEALLAQGVDALAVIGVHHDPVLGDIALPGAVVRNIPVVYVSGEGRFQPHVAVYYDQRQAGYQAAEHLLQIGCRRLLFLAPFATPWLEERVAGARVALKHAGLPETALCVYPPDHPLGQWSPDVEAACDAAIHQAFADGLVEGGVLTPNDGIALLLRRIAEENGREPGRDFALIGFDDIPQSGFCGLSSIRPPSEEMGREAARLLLRNLSGENVQLQVCLRSHLMARASTTAFAP